MNAAVCSASIGYFYIYTGLITFKTPPFCRRKGVAEGVKWAVLSLVVVLQAGFLFSYFVVSKLQWYCFCIYLDVAQEVEQDIYKPACQISLAAYSYQVAL